MVVAKVGLARASPVESLAGPGLHPAAIEAIGAGADPQVSALRGGQRRDVVARQRVAHGRIVPVAAIVSGARIAQEQAAATDADPEAVFSGRQQGTDVARTDAVGSSRVVRFEAEVAAVVGEPVETSVDPAKWDPSCATAKLSTPDFWIGSAGGPPVGTTEPATTSTRCGPPPKLPTQAVPPPRVPAPP